MAQRYSFIKNASKTSTFEMEEHPYPPFIPDDVETLIIGTFPTYKSNSKFDFFYSNPENSFWTLLAKVYNTKFIFTEGDEAKFERTRFLFKHKIGITDMISKCYRKNRSSSDESLYPILLNDIFNILDNNKSIRNILLTSRGEVGALGWLKAYFIQQGAIFKEPIKQLNRVMIGNVLRGNRIIKLTIPYSPSSRLITEGRIDLSELTEMYKYCLL